MVKNEALAPIKADCDALRGRPPASGAMCRQQRQQRAAKCGQQRQSLRQRQRREAAAAAKGAGSGDRQQKLLEQWKKQRAACKGSGERAAGSSCASQTKTKSIEKA